MFLLVKYALVDFSPMGIAFMQSLVGALGLFAIVVVEGGETRAALRDILRRPVQALILGALGIAAPFMLIALGELSVPSGLSGVLASTTPVFVALFAPWIDPSIEINRRQGVGLAVGLLGVALVVGAHFVGSLDQFLGAMALLGSAASGALAGFVVRLRYRDKGVPASTTSFFALSVAALLIFPAAVVTAPRELPGARAVAAVVLLGLGCTALGYMLYYRLINEVGSQRAALANYLLPAFALFYGVLLLGETLTVAGVVGLLLIIGGAAVAARGGGDGNRPTGGGLGTRYRFHPPFH
jgi:drug/metabolite transporter (DMT)-like permease